MAEKSKVKSYARRTKKGVARVAGHARNNKKKIAIETGAVLGIGTIVGGAVALKKGAGKNLLKKHGKKVSTAMTNTPQTIGKAVNSVGSVANDFVEVGTQRAKSATQQAIQTAQRGGAVVKDSTRAIVPVNKPTVSNKSMKTPIGKVGKKVVETGRATVDLGKQTRKAFNEGYANPGTGGAYQVGRNIFGGVKNTVGVIDALVKRATKKRGK